MCGIFGYVSKNKEPVNLATLRQIAAETMTRGPHAWGLAWVAKNGLIKSYKQQGRIVDSLALLSMLEGSHMLIGHCRWATHGSPELNANNHPHDAGDAWVVHNGVIHDYYEIAQEHGLKLKTQCDSEVLSAMIKKFRGKPMTRAIRTVREAMGRSPFAMMALWPDRLIASATNGQPLHVGETRSAYYLASLGDGLPGCVSEWNNGEIVEYA